MSRPSTSTATTNVRGGETGPLAPAQAQPIPHDSAYWNGDRCCWNGMPVRWPFQGFNGAGAWNGRNARWNGDRAHWRN